MAEFQLSAFLADFVHGEVHNPAEFVALPVHMLGAQLAQQAAEHAGGFLRGQVFPAAQGYKGIGFQLQPVDHRLLLLLEELGNTAGDFPLLIHLEPIRFIAGNHFRVGAELINLLARCGKAAHRHRLDPLAGKGAKAAVLQQLRDILAGQVNAQVGLVRAIALHGLQVWNPPEGRGGGHGIRAILGKDGRQDILQHRKNIFLGSKGHFHIQLIEFAGAAVPTGILVPKAGSNLEIVVKAGSHQQLLELLRRLGQRVEHAGMLPGRHQVIAGTLGRRGRQNGRGNLQEIMIGHGAAQRGNHLAAQDDVFLHLRIAQIQIAVLQPQGLIGFPAVVNLERQRVIPAAAQYFNGIRYHFHLTGGHIGVFAGALPHRSVNAQHALLIQSGHLLQHCFGFQHHLRGTIEVPQHQKSQAAANLPQVFHPTAELYAFSRIAPAKLSAGMGPILYHRYSLLVCQSLILV